MPIAREIDTANPGFRHNESNPMKLTRDLETPRLIHAKAVLFVVLGVGASALLLLALPTWRTAALLAVSIWAFCRFYYYLFYVLDRYLGREKRFAGVIDALRYLLVERTGRPRATPTVAPATDSREAVSEHRDAEVR